MATISLCMIVKNEEEVLSRCLESIKDVVDEMIIIDTGSQDATIEIAKTYSDKVFSYTWNDNFSDARNYSFTFAKMDYVMWLDADDVILPEDKDALMLLKEELSDDVDMVMLKYNTAFDKDGNPTFSYYRERLMKRLSKFYWEGYIHEVITPRGNIEYKEIAITHKKMKVSDSDRNLRIFEKQIQAGNVLSPREQFYYARELYYHKRFEDAILQFSLFIQSHRGWIENIIDACKLRSYCYYEIGKAEEAVISLLESFVYDIPRAETCCDIGKHFMDRGSYVLAIYWYEQATKCERNDTSGAFVQPDCYNYIPYLQMCVCFDKLSQSEKASLYNEKAALYKPQESAILSNREYFAKIGK